MADLLVRECRYLRLSCSDEDHPLFRRDYARSNRERGVKLLRCFPHCCPEHARRSYCGCSIHLLVTFSADVSAEVLDELVVCARFEPSRVAPLWPAGFEPDIAETTNRSDEHSLEPGESVVLPPNIVHQESVKPTKESIWIRAKKEGKNKQRTLPKVEFESL